MRQVNKDICSRLEQMNKRYIRKPECKQTIEDAIETIKKLRRQIKLDSMIIETAGEYV